VGSNHSAFTILAKCTATYACARLHRLTHRIILISISHVDSSAPVSMLDNEYGHNRNDDLANPNESEDNWVPDVETYMDPDNGLEDPESTQQWHLNTTAHVPGLMHPTWRSKEEASKAIMIANAIETRRNKGYKTK